MKLLEITYERDMGAYGEYSKERLEKLIKILESHGQLTIIDDYNYTLKTKLNPNTVSFYVADVLEADCYFKVETDGSKIEHCSGSYLLSHS